MTATEPTPKPRISWMAVASLVMTLIWYSGWMLTLMYGLLTYDMQGWNWLPYIVWGMWGVPALLPALFLGLWSLWRMSKRPQQLTGQGLAWVGVVCCLLAGPLWYGTQYLVVLIRQMK